MKLSQPIPVLRILDEAKAREFYVDFLGFSIDWSHRFDDNAPLYAQLSRDGCVVHLSEHYGDCNSGGALRIQADDIDGLNQELLQKQYKYARPGVADTPWLTREMKITDPFGNHLIFFRNLRAPTDLALDIAVGTAMTPVGMTSQWIAASRALETESADPLYRDPLARELAGTAGFEMMKVMRAAMGTPDTASPDLYLTIRTRYLDDAMLAAVVDGSITQAVILAAGMDMRAFRLDWPAGLTLFEVDRDDVFDHKEAVVERAHARPSCDRRIVRADLAQEGWVDDLVAAGYDAARPAAILVEGLLMYLDEVQVKQLLASIGMIAPKGSWIGADLVNTNMITSTFTAAYMKKLADVGCPWKWAVDDPDQFLAEYGWQGKAVVPGEPEASYKRWPFPAMPRTTPGIPRAYFVNARKGAAPSQ
jgi:methyltransferase (TIGR00027 family)